MNYRVVSILTLADGKEQGRTQKEPLMHPSVLSRRAKKSVWGEATLSTESLLSADD